MKIYRDIILPRLVFLPFFVSYILLVFLNFFSFYKFNLKRKEQTILCLESGIKGWDLIEYKELLGSAIDYLDSESVQKIVIDRTQPYFSQVRAAVRKYKPTHYMYDSRTGGDRWFQGVWQAFQIAIFFQLHGVVPICTLTDLPIRSWRVQTAVVTALRGVVVSLMSPRDVYAIFPHKRLIGPLTMPFSKRTMQFLSSLNQRCPEKFKSPSLVFIGSLYEPRTTLLRKVQEGLEQYGIRLEMKGRELGSRKVADEDYWERLVSASMVITTANQIHSQRADWAWIGHLIYRYIEVPLSGSVLIAQEVPSLRRYFLPGIHYIKYDNPEEAIEKIAYYWSNPELLKTIAENGKEKAMAIVNTNMYWVVVDSALGRYSLT